MSTQPITQGSVTQNQLSVTSLGSGSPLQVTGLASGLDTNSIVTALLSGDQQAITNVTNQQKGLQALNTQLQSIQTALQNLANSAQAVSDPGTFSDTQSITSTNSAIVGATATSSVGAVIGGYSVSVTSLATAAQRTFNFTSPSTADTVTIDGHQTSLAAGAQPQDFVNAINSDTGAGVWATLNNSGQVVLSERNTGSMSSYITYSESNPTHSLSEVTAAAQNGQNAAYSINGVGGTSASNTLNGAIPGVNLTLNGVTTQSGPVTITVGAPAPSTAAIQTAVQSFVSSYNTVIQQIQTQLAQTPSSSDPTQGTLFGDPELGDLLSSMREAMYSAGSGLPTGLATMMDIGVGTGATTGSASPSQTAIDGQLTVNATTLSNALSSNPNGVKAVMQAWSQSFSTLVNNVGAPGGTIDSRVQGDSTEISSLGNQINNMQSALAVKQQQLVHQYAQLESTLSNNQSTSSWLASQLSSLPVA